MTQSVLILLAYAVPIVAIVVSVTIGFHEVRTLRRATGDKSRLTALLGWDFRWHRPCPKDF